MAQVVQCPVGEEDNENNGDVGGDNDNYDGTGCPVGEEDNDNNGDIGGDNDNYDGTGFPVGEEDREGVGREPCEAFDGIVDHGTSCNLIWL